MWFVRVSIFKRARAAHCKDDINDRNIGGDFMVRYCRRFTARFDGPSSLVADKGPRHEDEFGGGSLRRQEYGLGKPEKV